MPNDIKAEIEALHQMTTGELAERYETLHGQPSRTRHRAYLIRKIAWRIQANAEGDLTERARKRAAELADDADVRVMAPKTMICPPQSSEPATVTRTLPNGEHNDPRNCLLYGSLVTLADGRRVPIETLSPGDEVRSLLVPGLKTDVPFRAQYEWLSTWGLDGATVRTARVSEIRLGEHDGFCVINRRIRLGIQLRHQPGHRFNVRIKQ